MPPPFTTTVVGSLPKPAWLYQQRPLAGPGTNHHGSGAELERSAVDQLALEFEAPDLEPALLEICPSKTVMFGCVDNAEDTVESPEAIAGRLLRAARHHDPEKLQAAPDCGLVPTGTELARAKLHAMVAGARLARERL